MKVRVAAMRRASSRIASGSTPQSGAGPFRRLRPAVAFAHEIGAEAIEPDRASRQEPPVGQSLVLDHMGERQHQRGVRAGAHGYPLADVRRVRPLRRDVDAADAFPGEPRKPPRGLVLGDPAHADLRVLRVDPAEHDQGFRVLVDRRPAFLMFVEEFQELLAEDVRHDRLGAAGGIAAEGGDMAADAVQEPVHLALCVMEASGGTPAV